MTRARWNCLLDRIADVKNPVGVELGVFKGQMSRELLKARSDLTLYMIDSWTPFCPPETDERIKRIYHDAYLENMSEAVKAVAEFGDRAVVIRENSHQAALNFTWKTLDFVFVDASHEYFNVKLDIELWKKRLCINGLLCGHDYGSWPGVKQAVDEIFPSVETDDDFFWGVRV